MLREANADDDVHVLVITSSGDFFSSGADLSDASSASADPSTPSYLAPVGQFMWELIHFRKPVIAAVNGPAVGIGTTLVLHADIVFCARSTYFWTPFARIAVVPEFVSSLLLPSILGPSLGNEMLLASRKLTSAEALQRGLVSDVLASADEVRAHAIKVAKDMLAPPLASKSLPIFKSLIRSPDKLRQMGGVFHDEMDQLHKRFMNGDTAEAAIMLLSQRAKL